MRAGSARLWISRLLAVSLIGVALPVQVANGQATHIQIAQAAGTDGPRRYRYRNSSQPVDAGTRISGHRMHVRLDASTTDTPRDVLLDDQRLLALCADEDGCKLTISVIGWVEGEGDQRQVLPTPTTTASCRFFIRVVDGRRHWQVEWSCSRWYALWGEGKDRMRVWRPDGNEPGFFAPYWSLRYGIDGVDGVFAPGDDRGWVINMSGACGISESRPVLRGTPGELAADNAPGFYLIATTAAWAGPSYPSQWPSRAPGRACELIVED